MRIDWLRISGMEVMPMGRTVSLVTQVLTVFEDGGKLFRSIWNGLVEFAVSPTNYNSGTEVVSKAMREDLEEAVKGQHQWIMGNYKGQVYEPDLT